MFRSDVGVTAWSLNSGVGSAACGLRCAVLLGWVVSGRGAWRPAAKMIKRTCSPDARGQTAIGHQEASPTNSHCAVQRITLAQCAHRAFPPPLFTNARRLIFTELPSRLKVLPEVRGSPRESWERARDRRRERCNRIITQGTSLKGTAAGGPIWALHQRAHTSVATTTGSQCCLIMADKDECTVFRLNFLSNSCRVSLPPGPFHPVFTSL